MKILMHDYGGHPFTLQLVKRLSVSFGNSYYVYSSSFITPNSKNLPVAKNGKYEIIPLKLSKTVKKTSFYERWLLEREYAKKLVERVRIINPDIVISSVTPIDPQSRLQEYCRRNKVPVIYWIQDVYGLAMKEILSRKFPIIGKLVGQFYENKEKKLWSNSDYIICITEDFIPILKDLKICQEKISILPNWGILEEIKPCEKNNEWATKNGLQDKFVFLYTGTLGFKHNPQLLIKLAEEFRSHKEVRVVVISEGTGADWLRNEIGRKKLDNLLVKNYQPFNKMSEVLGTGNILIAILEKEASKYSVPSKILNYHCAAKPILVSIPSENLASKIVSQNNSGLAVEPDDPDQFFDLAKLLYENSKMREEMGRNAYNYAKENFNMDHIASKFENIIQYCINNKW
jgi:colanic acid biosynthesis glycosyl transferase WcaI